MSATQVRQADIPALDLHLLGELGLEDEVLASRSLLDLGDDWDDCGSPGYAEATWSRAVDLLIRMTKQLQSSFGIRLTSVDVMPGSQGDIGLELQTDHRRLLISVPHKIDAPARYFGHDRDKTNTTKGWLDTALPNNWLVEWLAA